MAPAPAVTVWSDYLCPWCYLGQDRARHLREAHGCRVTWRPYDLHPEVPDEGTPAERFYGRGGGGYLDRLFAAAEEAGLPMRRPSVIPRTRQALEATEHVREHHPDRFDGVHHALFAAYWAHDRDLGDRTVVLDVIVAAAPEVDRERLADDLDQRRYATAVDRSRNEALSAGVSGIPAWRFDGTGLVVPGCQPREVFDRVLARLG